MGRPPRPPAEGLLDRVRGRLLVGGAAIGAAIFASFLIGDQTSHVVGQTTAFTTLVFGRLLFVFTVRGDGPFWQAGRNLRLFAALALSAAVALVVLGVPAVGERFGTTGLSGGQWLASLALAAVPLVVPELWKLAQRRFTATGARSPIGSADALGARS
jgi:magnesium-transporting ATPase (P-type)